MTSKISLSVGPAVAEAIFANDAKVQATLLAYYRVRNLGENSLSNQAKLQLIVADLTDHIIATVRNREVDVRRSLATTTIETDVETEFDFRGGL